MKYLCTVHVKFKRGKKHQLITLLAQITLQEAKYHWNMAKQMGVSFGVDHESIIDRIWAMENRDRKEVEKLGNRNGAP